MSPRGDGNSLIINGVVINSKSGDSADIGSTKEISPTSRAFIYITDPNTQIKTFKIRHGKNLGANSGTPCPATKSVGLRSGIAKIRNAQDDMYGLKSVSRNSLERIDELLLKNAVKEANPMPNKLLIHFYYWVSL
jgi:hypothetical protein